MQNLRRVLFSLISKSGRSLLIKNLYSGLRLAPIVHYIPEAVFIVIERDIIDNARSILEARKNQLGNYETWFSMKPPGYEKMLTFPPHEQVVEQIRAIYGMIYYELEGLPDNRMIKVRYENLCTDPEKVIAQIKSFFTKIGVEVGMRCISLLPFTVPQKIRIQSDLYEALCHYVKENLEV
jgi:hypothetical protein